MSKEVIENIGVIEGGVFGDFTFGDGGHSEQLLIQGANRVIGIDRDEETILNYLAEGKFRNDPRLGLIHSNFAHFALSHPSESFDGILLDLGVSTRQLMDLKRGFSFQGDNDLDMRMDRSEGVLNAREAIAKSHPAQIAIYLELAGVKKANKVAQNLFSMSQSGELKTTRDLVRVAGRGQSDYHPATQLFLGVRLFVNREFEETTQAINRSIDLLKPGGTLLIITFHSAEDRLVKKLFAIHSGKCGCDAPICTCPKIQRVTNLFKKPLEPTHAEILRNKRARSAKLRGIRRLLE